MTAPVEAIYENGVFRPLGEVSLPEGKRVQIAVLAVDGEISDPAYNLADLAEETGITDLAVNIDHYLYGLPKQNDEQVIR
jgi:predicted DNA-binding antitoxin AbrB/MazE fold protein